MKTFSLLISLIGVLWFAPADAALEDRDAELKALQFAESAAALEKIEDRLNVNQILDEDCRAELNQKVIPRSCFRSLALRGVEAPPWLKSDCVARARSSKSRLELRGDIKSLPLTCQSAAAERLADLDYLDASERPSEIWTLERNVN